MVILNWEKSPTLAELKTILVHLMPSVMSREKAKTWLKQHTDREYFIDYEY